MLEPRPYGVAVIVRRRWLEWLRVSSLYMGSDCRAAAFDRRIFRTTYKAPTKRRETKMRPMRAMSRSIMVSDISDGLLSSRRERRLLLLAMREEMESIAEIEDVEKS